MRTHDHFEELCALAASGQVSESEREELDRHLPTCAECRGLLRDLAQISAQALPEAAEMRIPEHSPRGITERFIARAHSDGLFLSPEPSADRQNGFHASKVTLWGTAAVTVLLIVFSLRIITARRGPSTPSDADSKVSSLLRDNASLRKQVDSGKADRDQLAQALLVAEKNLESAEHRAADATGHLEASEAASADLRRYDQGREVELAGLKQDMGKLSEELSKLRSEKEADRIALLMRENEAGQMRERLAQQEIELDRLNEQQHWNSIASQAQSLVVARNLHIVDVHDTDADGKGQRAFGRIFYSEGQSLVFYAYDLDDPRKLNARISFYVWGGKEGDNEPVKSLGIFHSDDPNDRRWVLKFDDPKVLAQINSVFVTVETSKKTVAQPTGKKILFAFLGNRPNHP